MPRHSLLILSTRYSAFCVGRRRLLTAFHAFAEAVGTQASTKPLIQMELLRGETEETDVHGVDYGERVPDEQCTDDARAQVLVSMGREFETASAVQEAVRCYHEALQVYQTTRLEALIDGDEETSRECALESALLLHRIGLVLMRDDSIRDGYRLLSSAKSYIDCLDAFLQAATERVDNICEQDRVRIGEILCSNLDFRSAVRDIRHLLLEMEFCRFVGSSASSRRRSRTYASSSVNQNLLSASLSLARDDSPDDKAKVGTHSAPSSGDLSRASSGIDILNSRRNSGSGGLLLRRSKPSLIRRSMTSDEDRDQYQSLAQLIGPAEHSLRQALDRFSLTSV